jgi:hypothetical protein
VLLLFTEIGPFKDRRVCDQVSVLRCFVENQVAEYRNVEQYTVGCCENDKSTFYNIDHTHVTSETKIQVRQFVVPTIWNSTTCLLTFWLSTSSGSAQILAAIVPRIKLD